MITDNISPPKFLLTLLERLERYSGRKTVSITLWNRAKVRLDTMILAEDISKLAKVHLRRDQPL